MQDVVIQATDLKKEFSDGAGTVQVLHNIDLSVRRGEFVAIMGPSGCGKTTLLSLIGGLDRPTAGQIILDGCIMTEASEDELAEIRNEKIGFVFQDFNLIPTLSALDNVALPICFRRNRPAPSVITEKARSVLTVVGLQDRLTHKPRTLSGGEQQRVAIARSLINDPSLLLADEPTGNLDSDTGDKIIHLLLSLQERLSMTLVIVTHDAAVASLADRVLTLQGGRLETQKTK